MSLEVLLPNHGVIRLMLLGIALLFLFGLWHWKRAQDRIVRELAAAQRLLSNPALKLRSPPVPALLGKDEKSLPGRLITTMMRHNGLAFARPADALEPALDEVGRVNASARTIPNLLLLAGLVTTVVGLISTLVSLGPQIQGAINAANPGEVSRALGTTLQEMSAAFAGTFWGVALSLVLQALNAWTGVRAGHLSGQLDEITSRFAPLVYPAGTEKQLQSLQDLVNQTTTFLNQTQASIERTSTEFAMVLTRAGGVMESSLKTLQTTSEKVSLALQAASGDVKLSSDRLNSAVEMMQQHRQDYLNIYAQFNDMFTESMAALRTHSDGQLKELRASQSSFEAVGANIVAEIFKTADELHGVSSKLALSQAAYVSGTETVAMAVQGGFNDLHQRLGETLSHYTMEANTVGQQLQGLTEQLAGSAKASHELQRTLVAKDNAEVTRSRDQHQQHQMLATHLQVLSATLAALEPRLDALQAEPEWAKALEGAIHDTAREAQGSRAELHGQLRSLGEQLRPTGTQELERQLTQVATLLEGVLDQLSALSDAAPQQAAVLGELRESVLQGRDSSERIRQLLEALPGHLTAGTLGELRRSQDALGERLAELTRMLSLATAGDAPSAAVPPPQGTEPAAEPPSHPVGGPSA